MIHNLKIIEISVKMKKQKIVNDKLGKLTSHKKLRKSNLNDVMLGFDAASLYPSAMWVEKSVYPKIENGVAFKHHMDVVFVVWFKS